jgi:hypothetical protein
MLHARQVEVGLARPPRFGNYVAPLLTLSSRPTFSHFASDEERRRPLALMTKIIVRLESVSEDEDDTPYLYADFLRRLLHQARSWIPHPRLPPPRLAAPTVPAQQVLADQPPVTNGIAPALGSEPGVGIPAGTGTGTESFDPLWLNNVWDVSHQTELRGRLGTD